MHRGSRSFSLPAAPGAITRRPDLGVDDVKISSVRNSLLHLVSQWILEFNYAAALQAHQVVMLNRLLRLIMMMAVVDVDLLSQPKPFERMEDSVNRGETQPGLFGPGLAVNLICVRVSLPSPDNLEDQGALPGGPDAGPV